MVSAEQTALICQQQANGVAVGEAGWQVMNEVALHRGRHTHLTVVDTYFDGQHLTEAVVSPPTFVIHIIKLIL